jgi:hypothetical protein
MKESTNATNINEAFFYLPLKTLLQNAVTTFFPLSIVFSATTTSITFGTSEAFLGHA